MFSNLSNTIKVTTILWFLVKKSECFAPNKILVLSSRPQEFSHVLTFASESIVQGEEKKKSKKTSNSQLGENNGSVSTRFHSIKAMIPRKGSTAFSVDRLERSPNFEKLEARDRSFCRLLVTTTERRLGQIDAVLNACMNEKPRRTNRVDQFVQAALRVGAAQLLFLQVPPHAAVKETIDVLRMDNDIKVSVSKIKFANAILRRLSREGEHLLASVDGADVTANASPWLVEEFQRAWGKVATERILAAAMEESPRCLTVNLQQIGRITSEDTAEFDLKLFESSDSGSLLFEQQQVEYVAKLFPGSEILPQGSIRIVDPPPGTISTWPLYQKGVWWCQDPSATLPAIALYQALSQNGKLAVDDRHVIDLCSAPGGKTAQLSNYNFASVTAVEKSLKRCDRLKQNMKRLNMQWNVVVADGTEWSPREPVDAVLIDVPCTATGTGSKRPDVLRTQTDISELETTQFKLACHAADEMINVGGVIVYATCSLLKQESEDQAMKLLQRTDGAVLKTIPFQPGEIPGFDDAIDENGWMRVLPGFLPGSLSQCDGFFVARFERVK